MATDKLAFRIPEAVEASGIGRTKLYELIAAGDIQVTRVGRRTLVLRDSLVRFLERPGDHAVGE